MLKTGRYIILYISLTVIQVHSSKDPVNLKLTKLIARNENPLVVYMDPEHHLIKLYDGDGSNEDKERKKANSLIYYDKSRVNNNEKLDKLLDNLDEDKDGDENDYYEQTLEETARDRAKYLFYNFLRTSPDEDSEFQETRQFLRQALRSRCKKVDTCVKKCEVTEPKCPNKCQNIFDEQNLCEPPKRNKCKKPRCGWGSTMPPRWLL